MTATRHTRRRIGSGGFTLVELLVALTILVLAMGITFLTFANVSRAWQRGIALSNDLTHGDFVMEQIVNGLRSAYAPDSAASISAYGLWMDDGGSGDSARDTISWVKLGPALVGTDSGLAGAPHRVRVGIETDTDGEPVVGVTAWRPYAQPEDFDASRLQSVMLSREIVGLNVRMTTNAVDREIDWQDTWEDERTNRLPSWVEVTLYLRPLDSGDRPVELKRLVAIPRGPAMAWQ